MKRNRPFARKKRGPTGRMVLEDFEHLLEKECRVATLSSVAPCSCSSLRLRFVVMATPTDMNDRFSQIIKEAEEVCVTDNGSDECAAAWDEVEEISAEIAHKRAKQSDKKDPLEEFCKDAAEADECRVYED
ncbi:hypothetical protein L7F22_024984 [Adiantum nelumboides]|nr:hypothetical protein [Adiantum nelumboides]